jgi:hypothetical protein
LCVETLSNLHLLEDLGVKYPLFLVHLTMEMIGWICVPRVITPRHRATFISQSPAYIHTWR